MCHGCSFAPGARLRSGTRPAQGEGGSVRCACGSRSRGTQGRAAPEYAEAAGRGRHLAELGDGLVVAHACRQQGGKRSARRPAARAEDLVAACRARLVRSCSQLRRRTLRVRTHDGRPVALALVVADAGAGGSVVGAVVVEAQLCGWSVFGAQSERSRSAVGAQLSVGGLLLCNAAHSGKCSTAQQRRFSSRTSRAAHRVADLVRRLQREGQKGGASVRRCRRLPRGSRAG